MSQEYKHDLDVRLPDAREAAIPCNPLLVDYPFFALYKQRDPDPGVCRIITIDWENRRISMSNGQCRYSPSFDEVEIVTTNATHEGVESLSEHKPRDTTTIESVSSTHCGQSSDWRWCGDYTTEVEPCPKCSGSTRNNHHGRWCATCNWSIRTDNEVIVRRDGTVGGGQKIALRLSHEGMYPKE